MQATTEKRVWVQKLDAMSTLHDGVERTDPSASEVQTCYLERAIANLEEARLILSIQVSSAEPPGEMFSSSPTRHPSAPRPREGGDNDLHPQENKASVGGAGKAPPAENEKRKGKGSKKSPSDSVPDPSDAEDTPDKREGARDNLSGSISTPLGRELALVQLEEACARMLLGREKGECESSRAGAGLAPSDIEGTNAVER